MQVQAIMHTGERNAVVQGRSSFREVLEEMNNKGLGAVCVVDGPKLVGMITDGDVRRLLLSTQKPLPHLFMTPVAEMMVKSPKTVTPTTSLEDCLALFEQHRFWVAPVVDQERNLLGMVHLHTLLKAMVK